MYGIEKVLRTGAAAAAAAAIWLSSSAGPVRAEVPGFVKAACKKDFKTFCPHYALESTALKQCMRSVANQLSPRCIDALERNGEGRKK